MAVWARILATFLTLAALHVFAGCSGCGELDDPEGWSGDAVFLPDSDEEAVHVPHPSEIAPGLDLTGTTDFDESIDFLFKGDSPVQFDVDEEALDRARLGVVRGRVLDTDGEPLSAVRVYISGRPELGHSYSRSDGMFDMAVNAGGQVNVTYKRHGYAPVQRPVQARWNDYTFAPDIVMTRLEARGSVVDFASTPRLVVGSQVDDDHGSRRVALWVPKGTRAEMVLEDGEREQLSRMTLRPTELTVGEGGPEAMPGPLPTAVAYTYATSFSVDEAVAAGAKRVEFNRTAYMYVDNFLEFPTGQATPSAYYDYDRAAWVPEDNGRVIAVLASSGGTVSLDVDGSGRAASNEALGKLGITAEELNGLAQFLDVGDSFWRIPIVHLTPYDINWPIRLPGDALSPGVNYPSTDRLVDRPCREGGSIIDSYQQSLMQVVPLAGSPHHLVYSSARSPGRLAPIDVAVHDGELPSSLREIVVDVSVRGQHFHRKFKGDDIPRSTRFLWDGLDAYGRTMQGESMAFIRLRYVYEAEFGEPAEGDRSFGLFDSAGSEDPNGLSRAFISLDQTWSVPVHRWLMGTHEVAGWSLDIHHRYDRLGRTLIMGDGRDHQVDRTRQGTAMLPRGGHLSQVTADTDFVALPSDDGSAPARDVHFPHAIKTLVAEDGSLYILETTFVDPQSGLVHESGVRRILRDGTVERVAGQGRQINTLDPAVEGCLKYVQRLVECAGNGGLATEAEFHTLRDFAFGPDGSLYLMDYSEGRVRRIGPDGIITAVTGYVGDPRADREEGQGMQATGVDIGRADRLDVGEDGSVYVAASLGHIFRIMPDGSLHTLTAPEECNPWEDENACVPDGRPLAAHRFELQGIAASTRGDLYLLSRSRLMRVTAGGLLETLLVLPDSMQREFGQPQSMGDQSLGLHVDFNDRIFLFNYSREPGNQDGQVYYFDEKARELIPQMGFVILAGGEAEPWAREVWPADARQALDSAVAPMDVAGGPDGELYVLDKLTQAVFRVGDRRTEKSDGAEYYIPSPDARLLYVFDERGRHLRTLDARDQSVVYGFEYDDSHRLVAVADKYANRTVIERGSQGQATAIVSPFGHRTDFELNDEGLISQVINPNDEAYGFQYTDGGLMTGWTD
ncbi:MAG: hypothetical protein ACNA8W_14725, partial [Bradymonadaceae bacterium]